MKNGKNENVQHHSGDSVAQSDILKESAQSEWKSTTRYNAQLKFI